MDFSDFVTDMAVDAAERGAPEDKTAQKTLSYGIVQKTTNLKSAELARQLGRARGVYVTYESTSRALDSERGIKTLATYMANTMRELIGTVRRSEPVLVVGLGNDTVLADSLGGKVARSVRITGIGDLNASGKQRLCAFSAGVEGMTGIKTVDLIASVCQKIKPSAVILVDSLATSSVSRLGVSYQLTTAGIAPGSGVGKDKDAIDKRVLGVPVVGIGVPLVLSMRTLLSDYLAEYNSRTGSEGDEYKAREVMADKRLSGLVVAPKEIKLYVELASNVIATAINAAYADG